MSALALAISLAAWADTITVDGKRYEDVLVRESPTRYYFWVPGEDRTISISKGQASEVSFTTDLDERNKLIEEWVAHQQNQKSCKTSIKPSQSTPPGTEPIVIKPPDTPPEFPTAAVAPAGALPTPPGAADITAQTIIGAYARLHDSIHGITAHYNETVSSHNQLHGQYAGASGQVQVCHEAVFSLDLKTGRYLHADYQWRPREGQTRSGAQFIVKHWDGDSFYQYSAGKNPRGSIDRPGGPIAREAKAHPLMSMCRNFAGGALMGYPIQAELRFDRFLGNAPLVLRPQTYAVGNLQCRVIEADTRFGHVTAWFAPDCEYSLVQYAILQGAGDTYRNASVKVAIGDVQQVNGLWLPKSGRITEDWRMLDGGFILRDTTVRLDSLVINPDFEVDHTFDLVQYVPNGSVWTYLDNQKVPLQFVNGQFVQAR
ncbi:MAG: hypothetical protein IT365_27660 [Candidatus Hydrogenedentes bacterium]|nr:hypothetical protein [Candidatus Hydrogenedentota bacterium]